MPVSNERVGGLVDFRCPNARCGRYLFTVVPGTVISRGYCRACGLKYTNQVAR